MEEYKSSLSGAYGWTTLNEVRYGPGSVVTALPLLMTRLGARKALVVTGSSLFHKTNVIKKVETILLSQHAFGGTFFEIGQHAPIAGIRNGAQAFKSNGCDIIVSVGGGSPIDAAKAILHMISEETGGPVLPHIAIPTTLSAAEYTVGAGYTSEDGEKTGVTSPFLAPSGVVLDAELTLETPERLWLSTGLRALDHAVENLYRTVVPLPVKVLCYAAIVDLFKYLPLSKANPKDVSIRQKLQVASWMSLWPLRTEKYEALGLSHLLGHSLGATYGIPHGITSCLTLAPVVALKATTLDNEEDKEALAAAIYHLRRPSTGSVEGDIKLFASLIDGLVEELGLKSSLTEYGVPDGDLPSIAQKVVGDGNEEMVKKVERILLDLR